MLVNDSAPSPELLGTVHGMASSISSTARIMGPVVGGILLGWGLAHNLVGLPLWLLGLVAIMNWAILWRIDDMDMSSPWDEIYSLETGEHYSLLLNVDGMYWWYLARLYWCRYHPATRFMTSPRTSFHVYHHGLNPVQGNSCNGICRVRPGTHKKHKATPLLTPFARGLLFNSRFYLMAYQSWVYVSIYHT